MTAFLLEYEQILKARIDGFKVSDADIPKSDGITLTIAAKASKIESVANTDSTL